MHAELRVSYTVPHEIQRLTGRVDASALARRATCLRGILDPRGRRLPWGRSLYRAPVDGHLPRPRSPWPCRPTGLGAATEADADSGEDRPALADREPSAPWLRDQVVDRPTPGPVDPGGVRSPSPPANRQRIVELFPTAHRRVSVTPNRQRIVEIGGGSNASSCVEVTPGAAVAVPQQGLRRGEMGNGLPRNSRSKRTVGCTGGSTQAPVASSPDPRGWPSNRHFSTRQVAVPADTRLHDALTVVVTLQAPRCVVGSHIPWPTATSITGM